MFEIFGDVAGWGRNCSFLKSVLVSKKVPSVALTRRHDAGTGTMEGWTLLPCFLLPSLRPVKGSSRCCSEDETIGDECSEGIGLESTHHLAGSGEFALHVAQSRSTQFGLFGAPL